MSSLSQWNEAQKDDIVRCQAENRALREKIHIALHGCNPRGGTNYLLDNLEFQKLSQQRNEILAYVKEKYDIQTYKELKTRANEITQQRGINHQFDQQLQQYYEPVQQHTHPLEQLSPMTNFERVQQKYEQETKRQQQQQEQGKKKEHDQ